MADGQWACGGRGSWGGESFKDEVPRSEIGTGCKSLLSRREDKVNRHRR